MSIVQSASNLTQQLQQVLSNSTVPTPSAGASAANSSATAAVTGSAATQADRFLKLLVAQMKNQDPLNPLDNAQVTSQMAQISTVSGIEQLNQTLTTFMAGNKASSPLDALSAIGRSVLVDSDTFQRVAATDGPVHAGFTLASAADKVQVEILDATGQTVYSQQMGAAAAGTQVFQWDAASAPPGSYRVKVTATMAGKPVGATPLTAANVLGIIQGSDGISLQLAGRAPIAAGDIKGIF